MHRKNITTLKVTIGTSSLITPEPYAQIISVFAITLYPAFDAVNKVHDLAIIQVYTLLLIIVTAINGSLIYSNGCFFWNDLL